MAKLLEVAVVPAESFGRRRRNVSAEWKKRMERLTWTWTWYPEPVGKDTVQVVNEKVRPVATDCSCSTNVRSKRCQRRKSP